ncbi:hypothetical protein Tco_0980327 [Tanacetum coccineum]
MLTISLMPSKAEASIIDLQNETSFSNPTSENRFALVTLGRTKDLKKPTLIIEDIEDLCFPKVLFCSCSTSISVQCQN